MNKRVSVVLIVALIMSLGVVFASDEMYVQVTKNESRGNEFIFGLMYSVPQVSKGDEFKIGLPFPMNIDGGNIFDIEDMGNNIYKMTAIDDFINVKGNIGGKKTVFRGEEIPALTVNGKVITDDYNLPSEDYEVGTNPRDAIYKTGQLKGDRIFWSIFIRADKTHLHKVNVFDEVGNGQVIDKDSVKFSIMNSQEQHNNEEHIVNHVVKDVEIEDDTIFFRIENLNHLDAVNVVYETIITDFGQGVYENQLQIEGENKSNAYVTIEDWSDVDGEPKPNEPDEPTKPTDPILPQVGESYLKIEYVIGALFILLGATLNSKQSRKR